MIAPDKWPGKEYAQAMAMYVLMSDKIGVGWEGFCERYMSLSRSRMKALYSQLVDAVEVTNMFREVEHRDADLQQRG